MSLRALLATGILLVVLTVVAAAQAPAPSGEGLGACCGDDQAKRLPDHLPVLDLPVRRPQMPPELALHTYLTLANRQLTDLGSYSDETVVEADLPGTKQHGRYELRRSFLAPKSLAYAAIRFIGDGFVKTNIITRLLQSEVDHVEKGQGPSVAITEINYKFSFKAVEALGDRTAYMYQVKPRRKAVGLFKGKIFLDPVTGHPLRAEGTMVKSPSFFIKKLEFVQDYTTVGAFSFPAHIHSVAKTRVVGRAVVDIFHSDYRAKPLAEVKTTSTPATMAGASNQGTN
jgi:hypothetical protein